MSIFVNLYVSTALRILINKKLRFLKFDALRKNFPCDEERNFEKNVKIDYKIKNYNYEQSFYTRTYSRYSSL